VIQTLPLARKLKTYVSTDNARRCKELALGLATIMDKGSIRFVLVELPHGGALHAKALAAMSMATAVACSVCALKQIPLYGIQPLEIKRAVSAAGPVSKEQVQEFIEQRYGRKVLPAGRAREHIADAMMCLVVAEDNLENYGTA
jgi:Holliday junction resolvasome RuvABC endonuclease subunit